jgi:Uma2 family endonuclease
MSAPHHPPARRIKPGRAAPSAGRNGTPGPGPWTDWPVAPDGLPTLFEDEGQDDMGEARQHFDAIDILFNGIRARLADRPEYAVLSNMNLYYRPRPNKSHVSPDVMVVQPPERLPRNLGSYRLGPKRPVPVLTAEVLSLRSFQQQDLWNKPILYRRLGVVEYLLIDPTGELLADRLLLRRAAGADAWADEPDTGGGVTSALGFRVILEGDGRIRVFDAATGRPYPRPDEADAEAAARQAAEARVRELEAELARLKAGRESPPRRGKTK